ncbi:MAG TPA: ribonuclease HII [Candidatus Omnitrophota bacterium]|nr:ribonuclease HII [Candidatus Omnitrophota bacterium]
MAKSRASLYFFEEKYRAEGFRRVAGVDEAGRGPLAGPVVAAAVILPGEIEIKGLNDSKQLSERIRESLFVRILESAEVGVGLEAEAMIDEVNIYQASRRAMMRAIQSLRVPPDAVLADGMMRLETACPAVDIVHGDARSASIAAASIIAKVVRDHIMLAYHELAPQFSFNLHKGYGTREHLHALETHGPSEFHRRSFRPIKREPAQPLLF